MTDILLRIAEYKRAEIAEAKALRPLASLVTKAETSPPPRGFLKALRAARAGNRYGLIAEIKMKSPSKGMIRSDFNPPVHACAYVAGGATCLSVLTDNPSFGGSLEHLCAVRAVSPLPTLRKDFLFDPYQVVESRASGADAILIILAAIDDALMRDLEATAKGLDLDVIIEVHDESELDRAMTLSSPLIGINNRNLQTFQTSLEVTERLARRVPADRLVISESGICSPADLARLAQSGVTSFLVGDSLMRQADLTAATQALLADLT